MRKYSLRQTANRYLKTDNRGSFRNKKHRAFVIHKVIDDLFVIGNVPASWKTLKIDHMQQLVQYWRKQKIKTQPQSKIIWLNYEKYRYYWINRNW